MIPGINLTINQFRTVIQTMNESEMKALLTKYLNHAHNLEPIKLYEKS